jgi:hypothetical protein
MELLVALVLTAIGEVVKPLTKRFGETVSKRIVLGTVLVGSVAWTLLTDHGVITQEMIESVLQTALASVGIYEVVVKKFVYPAMGR